MTKNSNTTDNTDYGDKVSGNKSLSSPWPSIAHTVQKPTEYDTLGGDGYSPLYNERTPILYPWGSQRREEQLRNYDHHSRATLWMGASRGVAKKIASSPWVIKGSPPELVAHWQHFLMKAEFGKGWGPFSETGVLNYMRHDLGWILEIIGMGNPSGPIVGDVLGIASLDPRYCYPTGNPIHPFYFYDIVTGKYHKMHHTRIHQIVDSGDNDRGRPNRGLCALSRSIDIVHQGIMISQYVQQVLDDKPPPGITTIANVSKRSFDAQIQSVYGASLRNDELGPFGRNIMLFGIKPSEVPQVNTSTFSTTPEKFNYIAYTEMHVKMMAMTIGISSTELWELTSQALGTSTQSIIMAQQSEGKIIGMLRAEVERFINKLIPKELEFSFEYEDTEKDEQIAKTAQTWANVVQLVSDKLTPDEQRQLLANNAMAFRDVLTDPDGSVRRLTDADPETINATEVSDTTEIVTDEDSQTIEQPSIGIGIPSIDIPSTGSPEPEPEPDTSEESMPQNIVSETRLNGAQITAMLDVLAQTSAGTITGFSATEALISIGIAPEKAAQMVRAEIEASTGRDIASDLKLVKWWKGFGTFALKEWSQTRNSFIADMQSVFETGHSGRRAGAQLSRNIRTALRNFGTAAYIDGMNDGGVDTTRETLTDEDQANIEIWISTQSKYVTSLLGAQSVTERQEGLSPEAANIKASLWANKSLRDVYNDGLLAARGDAMMLWTLGQTEVHCPTCSGLNGQVHRASAWKDAGLKPGVDKLDCNGFNCDCSLDITDKKANGSLERYKQLTWGEHTYHVIGDSHVSVFTGSNIIADIYPHVNKSSLSWIDTIHRIESRDFISLAIQEYIGHEQLLEVLEKISKKEPIILVFGDIDRYVHLPKIDTQVTQKAAQKVTPEYAAQKYLSIVKIIQDLGYDVYVFGVTSPAFDDPLCCEKFETEGSREARENATRAFNEVLEAELNRRFVSIEAQVTSSEEYFIDGLHLGSLAVPIIEEAFHVR